MNIGALSNPSYGKQQAEYAGARRLCQDQSNLASPMDFTSILQNNVESGGGLISSGHFRQPKHTKNSILGSSGSDMKLNEFAGGLKNHMTTSGIPSKFESNKKSEQEAFDCQDEYCQDIRNDSYRFDDQDHGLCADQARSRDCSGRGHLKRTAKAMKNRKYDESNYLVDYSGNHNKLRKVNEECNILSSMSRSGASSGGKIGDLSGLGKNNKRSLKL